jgi:hypothetical protein
MSDIKNFYLNTFMDYYEYMRVLVKVIPPVACSMQQYQLAPLVHDGYVPVEIRKGMYGLPKPASSLTIASSSTSQNSAAYAEHPPGLFTHTTRPILFGLVVDDFEVQYTGCEHAQHLVKAPESLYTIITEWPGTRYLGLTMDWDYKARIVDMSMPGYSAPSTCLYPATSHRRHVYARLHRTGSHRVPARASQMSPARTASPDSTHPRCIDSNNAARRQLCHPEP